MEGDVLLASVALDDGRAPKVRPVVVVRVETTGRILICPVSSKSPYDATCLSLAIEDFAEGGLDLFQESYIMTSRVLPIRNTDVIGKKGRLTNEALMALIACVPESSPATAGQRSRKGR